MGDISSILLRSLVAEFLGGVRPYETKSYIPNYISSQPQPQKNPLFHVIFHPFVKEENGINQVLSYMH